MAAVRKKTSGALELAVAVGDIVGGLLVAGGYRDIAATEHMVDMVCVVRGVFFVVAKPFYRACMLPQAKALENRCPSTSSTTPCSTFDSHASTSAGICPTQQPRPRSHPRMGHSGICPIT